VRTETPIPTPSAPTSRVARTAARERRRRLTAAVTVLSVAGAAVAWLVSTGGGSQPAGSAASGANAPAAAGSTPAATLAVSLRGAAVPLMAIVRTGGDEVPVLTIPADLSLEVPGLGEGTSATVADQDGVGMRISLANTAGTWIDHYLALDMDGIAALADGAGGLTLTLPGTATLPGRTVGPGEVTLTGSEVAAYLGIDGPNAFTRWEVVLPALLEARTGGLTGDSDDLGAVSRLLPVGGETRVDTFPTRTSASSSLVPDYRTLDRLMAADFSVVRPPIGVLVQNGTGEPGVGAEVAARIVPKGFRVVLSGNADDFDHRTTQVIAGGDDDVPDAQRALRALGVGELGVTRVPSGVADITILVGKDFTA
jgi:hypothetical protein